MNVMTRLSGKMKLAEMVDLNHRLLGILARLGFKPGFGETTVAESCSRYGINLPTFLMICNVYSSEEFIPTEEDLREIDIMAVVRYLRASHRYYVNKGLVCLSDQLEQVLEPCGEKPKKVIRSFFGQYKTELEKHFEYEERQVFPYVQALSAGDGSVRDDLRQVEDDHGNIEEKVDDLKNIILKYLPAECDIVGVADVLTFIYNLAEDLKYHTRIEDITLAPLITKLEEDGNDR